MSHFCVEQEFFLIESTRLDDVTSGLYGFALIDDRVVEDAADMDAGEPNGDGAYVYVKRQGDSITIAQDFMGSYGLYVFQEGDYFALSNSFMRLLEHLKSKAFDLTWNKTYADAFIAADLCSVAYGETLIREIRSLDRCEIVSINITEKTFSRRSVDYKENTVDLNTDQGLQALDSWYRKWTNLILRLYRCGTRIRCDLSGGFDTRIIFSLFLGAGIDLNKIYVCSINDGLHTHREDYQIATDISQYYGFELNNQRAFVAEPSFLSMDEVIDLSFYLKLGFHKQMYLKPKKYENKRVFFSGSGGECVRSYWNMDKEQFIRKEWTRCASVMRSGIQLNQTAVENVLRTSFDGIEKKFERFGRKIDAADMALNLYRETRCRNHFGKDILENYFGGAVKYCPLLDRELHKLRLCDNVCDDKNLLMAVILERYQPDLLRFRFEGGRCIAQQTLAHAREINALHPVDQQLIQEGKRCLSRELPGLATPQEHQTGITIKEAEAYIKRAFLSAKVKSSFVRFYPQEIYEFMRIDIESRTFMPLEYAVTGLAISKVMTDLEKEGDSYARVSDYVRDCISSGEAKQNKWIHMRIMPRYRFVQAVQTLKHRMPSWVKTMYRMIRRV